MISIRLRRAGAKGNPHFRVVVTESSAARDGAFIEVLGHYHPTRQPASVVLDVDRVKHWMARGAQPSDTVRSLLRKVESGAVDVIAGPSAAKTVGTAEPVATEPAGSEAPGAAAAGAAEAAEVPAVEPETEAVEAEEQKAQAAEAEQAEAEEVEEQESAEEKSE